jgi:UDP-N-acetylmuramate--alanine ligase
LIWSLKGIPLSSSEAPTVVIDGKSWLHFTGVAGSGMSGLALYHAMAGGTTTGSDRAFDRGQQPLLRAQLEAAGIEILPQDGRFVDWTGPATVEPDARPGFHCAAVVASTAIEGKIPDLQAARDTNIPILHRSELLARYVASHRTIAVSGTSGKSTVTAMIFTILRDCGLEPGLLTGGALAELTAAGHVGNAWAAGPGADVEQRPWLVIEADESDGSLVRYFPQIGVVLNLGLDHKEPREVLEMFQTFAGNTEGALLVGQDPRLISLRSDATTFAVEDSNRPQATVGQESKKECLARRIDLHSDGSSFEIDGVPFTIPVPGLFNVLNAAAAVAAGKLAGLTVQEMAAPLAGFGGVARRFQSVGSVAGVEVIDDFAHNPDKIAAALAAARTRLAGRSGSNDPSHADETGGRILAFFQPHGFGPTRFLRTALVETFISELGPGDILWMPEIFFAGGTVQRDISAADLIEDIRTGGRDARFVAARPDIVPAVAQSARNGDLVLVMGARDPSLTVFCREILESLKQ